MLFASDRASLKALNANVPFDGMECLVRSDNSRWVFRVGATFSDTTELLALTPAASSLGRWVRIDKRVHLKLAIAFGTADAAVLFTTPDTGYKLNVERLFWEVTTGFTGGSSSAIGVSSSNAAYNTKGDLLGGASGDVAATLVSGIKGGTIGAKFGSNGVVVLVAGDTLRFDRITSAFTAGAGFVHAIATQIT